MGKSSPQLPPTPDPNALINAQADANRITQYTPSGNLRFGYVGGQGQFVEGQGGDDTQSAAFTQETPFQTQMRAAQEGSSLGLGNVAFNRVSGQTVVGQNPDGSPIFANDPNFSNPFQTAPTLAGVSQAQDIDPTTGLPAFQSNINTGQAIPQGLNTTGLNALTNDPVGFRSNIEQTLFDRQLGLLQPEFNRQSQDLQQNLADRGIPITSQGYNDATNRLQSQQGEQMQRLAQQATLAAGQESDRIVNQNRDIRAQQFGERAAAGEFGLASQGQGFSQAAANTQLANAGRQDTIANQLLSNQIANQQRSRDISERNATRGQNFNELAALLGGQQVQQPSFFAPGSVDTQGAFAAQQAAQQNAYSQAMASNSSNLGGLFGLAGNLGAAYLLR